MVIFFTPKSILLQLVCQVGKDDVTKLRQSTVPFTWVPHINMQTIRCVYHTTVKVPVILKCVFFQSPSVKTSLSSLLSSASPWYKVFRPELQRQKKIKKKKVHLNIIMITECKMPVTCYFYTYMTYLMARHTSLWISDPIWSTGAMSSCHSSRPERRMISLFCSDWGMKNLNTTWREQIK